MLNIKFYKKGMSVKELCIIDQEIVDYYESLGSDDERIKALAMSLKLGVMMAKQANEVTQLDFTQKRVNQG